MFTDSFRRIVAVILGTVLATLLCSCSHENRPFQLPIHLRIEQSACLRKSTDTIQKLFKNQISTEKELSRSWDCIEKSVRLFKRYVVGKTPGKYSPKEIYLFLSENFLPDLKLPEKVFSPLLRESMNLKTAFIGGNEKYVTTEELERLLSWIGLLRTESIKLNPYLGVLNSSSKLHGRGFFIKASKALDESFQKIGEEVSKYGGEYRFENLLSLFKVLDQLDGKSALEGEIKASRLKFQSWHPVIVDVKNVLIGGNPDKIEKHEWSVIFKTGASVLSLYWDGSRFAFNEAASEKDRFGSLESIFKRSIDLLKASLSRQKHNNVISNKNLNSLIENFYEVGLIDKDIPVRQLKMAWLVLNSKVFNREKFDYAQWKKLRDPLLVDADPEQYNNSENQLLEAMLDQMDSLFIGLNGNSLAVISLELERWLKIQYQIYSGTKSGQRFKNLCQDSNDDAWSEMVCVSDSPWPLSLDEKGRLLFDRNRSGYSKENLAFLNNERALIRVLMLGYGDRFGLNAVKNRVSEEALKDLYFDFKPLLVVLGLVDPSNQSFYQRIYSEGNLFLARSDGNISGLTFLESVDYLHYALSGVSAATMFLEGLRSQCDSIDKDLSLVEIGCFRWNFKKSLKVYGRHLPGLVKFFESLGHDEANEFLRQLEITVRDSGASQDPISRGDVVELFVLLQYIETFIFRFDLDLSDTVDRVETKNAFRIYLPSLAKIFGQDPVSNAFQVEALFTYMLKTGSTPFREDPIANLEWLHWRWHPEKWSYEASRLELAKILASLSAIR